jgi:hypothetical protein
MSLTFGQLGRLLRKDMVQEARDCVLKHGKLGKGDEFAAKHIQACTADYVCTCAQRELEKNPTNTAAQNLQGFLMHQLSGD